MFEGRPVSRETPFCSGPRHESHPETGADVAAGEQARIPRVAKAAKAAPNEVWIRGGKEGKKLMSETWNRGKRNRPDC